MIFLFVGEFDFGMLVFVVEVVVRVVVIGCVHYISLFGIFVLWEVIVGMYGDWFGVVVLVE